MFKSSNFCHVASNNRNNVKAGLFVYRTTDDLATVSTSGYFNDVLIDLKLHDLIIHEKVDTADSTKVEQNLLCVTEKTLDNVGTAVIKSAWDKNIEEEIAAFNPDLFVKKDGSSVMTGPLLMRATDDFKCAVAPYWDGVGFFKLNNNNSVSLMASLEYQDGFTPAEPNIYDLGTMQKKWNNLYLAGTVFANTINNGSNLAVPNPGQADTLALKSQVDDAANSGEQLYTTGVWYAKMYAATTVPTGEEYEGRNYADFSQVDSDNNPIIVIYTYTSGAWAQTTTITPPATHNGYMTITSKIWDIAEQAGQQGGKVLWAHSQNTFTPYPLIISYDNISITGASTVSMPQNPVDDQIANVKFVLDSVGSSTVDGVSNCVTEIKENIKIEKSVANIYYIKSGSKFYVPNGSSSVSQNANLGSHSWNNLFLGGSKYMIIGNAGYFSTSDDGTNWAVATKNTQLGSKSWMAIGYNGTKYVALGSTGGLSTSTDGSTWTTALIQQNLGNRAWSILIYDGIKFIAIGMTGYISTSPDGTAWAVATENTTLGNHNWWDAAYDGTKYVLLGSDGHISTSTDGTTWTTPVQVANLGANSWRRIAYDGTKFVALGSSGYLSTSTDGTTWAAATQDTNLGNRTWTGLIYDGTQFIASSNNGYMAYSSDGTNWVGMAFTAVELDADKQIYTLGTSVSTGQYMVFYNYSNNTAYRVLISDCKSGTTPVANSMFYNPDTNIIDYYNGSAIGNGYKYSLPLAIMTYDNDVVVSVKELNGLTYIGQAVFAVPGITALIPNGRDSDGKLNNALRSITEPCLISFVDNTASHWCIALYINNFVMLGAMSTADEIRYDPETNFLIGFGTPAIVLGEIDVDSNGDIINWVQKEVFHSVGYDDFQAQKGASGYCRLPNGMIMQWVRVQGTQNQNQDVTLPTAFTSADSFTATVTIFGTNESMYPVTIQAQTATTVQLHRYTGGLDAYYFNIIAIGF